MIIIHLGGHLQDEDDPTLNPKLECGMISFRSYAKHGMQKFREGNLKSALDCMNRAALASSSQPLQERAIMLYCAGQFEEAAAQFCADVDKLERMKVYKATEMRLWHASSLNKLGRYDEAIVALDADCRTNISSVAMQMNSTIEFFAGRIPVEQMLGIIGAAEENQQWIRRIQFMGNFYIGLYFDLKNETALAQAFFKHSPAKVLTVVNWIGGIKYRAFCIKSGFLTTKAHKNMVTMHAELY